MGYALCLPPQSGTEINYVVHVHHTDSFPDSYLPESVIIRLLMITLNQELDEAMFSFDLVAMSEYHDFDEF